MCIFFSISIIDLDNFVEEGFSFRKCFNQATLRCITGNEVAIIFKEVHLGDSREH